MKSDHASYTWLFPSILLFFIFKLITIEYFFFIEPMYHLLSYKQYIINQFPFLLTYKIAWVFFIVSFAYFMNPKKGLFYLAIINFLNSSLVVILSIYVKAFHKLPTYQVLYALPNLASLQSSIGSLLDYKHPILFIDCFILLAAAFKINEKQLPPRRKQIAFLYACISIIILIGLPIQLKKTAERQHDPAFQFYHQDSFSAVYNHSYVVYCIREVVLGVMNTTTPPLTLEQQNQIQQWHQQRDAILAKANTRMEGIAQGKNILLIQVESLETILIHKTVNGKEITPFLNHIADQSLYFPNIYEQVGEGNSSDTEFMVNTSMYPLWNGVTAYRYAERSYPNALANILKEQGYYTLVAHGDRKTFWNRNNLYPGFGYDTFWGLEDYQKTLQEDTFPFIGMGISDRSFLLHTADKLENTPKPYIASIITLTSHLPFILPDDVKTVEFPEIQDENIRHYAESFAYVDAALEAFWTHMEQNGELENTVILLYGDHEGLNKYYTVEDSWKNERRIPLIIYAPDITPQVIDTIGGQIDIMPTLLHLLGINPYTYPLMGKNLLADSDGYALLNEGFIGHFTSQELKDLETQGYQISNLMLRDLDSSLLQTKNINSTTPLNSD